MATYQGKLIFSDLSGGFWSLECSDGKVYQLVDYKDLIASYSDGDSVELSGHVDDDTMGIGMVSGSILEVLDIKKRS